MHTDTLNCGFRAQSGSLLRCAAGTAPGRPALPYRIGETGERQDTRRAMSTPMDLNRAHWDESTDIHARGNVYGIEDFRAGRCQLHRVEVEELGDVSGKRL